MKMKYALILGLAVLLVLTGCATEGSSDYDYIPVGGAGCAFSADYPDGNVEYIDVDNREVLTTSFF